MYLGGNVWQSLEGAKVGDYGPKKRTNDLDMAGIQVELFDTTTNKSVYTTTTDAQGEYGFQKLNPMHKYKVLFTYDGMRFQNTTYTNDLSGGYSTAQESNVKKTNRSEYNDKFDEIDSSPHNYKHENESIWRKAYRSVHQNRR